MVSAISLNPPTSVIFLSMTSIDHPCRSAYLLYIENKSAANRLASSPPAAPRISMIRSLPSLGSFGKSKILISCSSFCFSFFESESSSLTIAAISSSSPVESISSSSFICCTTCLYFSYFSTVSRKSAISLDSSMKRLESAITSGSDKSSPNSS